MRLPSIRKIFQLLSQKDDKPVLIREARFRTMLGDKAGDSGIVKSADGKRAATMKVVVDADNGVMTSDIEIAVQIGKEVKPFHSHIRAERSRIEGMYEVKELTLDNEKLDPKKPGLVDLAMNRMMWYQRHLMQIGGAPNRSVPLPHVLVDESGLKSDISLHGSRLWKVGHYINSLRKRDIF